MATYDAFTVLDHTYDVRTNPTQDFPNGSRTLDSFDNVHDAFTVLDHEMSRLRRHKAILVVEVWADGVEIVVCEEVSQ